MCGACVNGDARRCVGATTWATLGALQLVLVWTMNVHDQDLAGRGMGKV